MERTLLRRAALFNRNLDALGLRVSQVRNAGNPQAIVSADRLTRRVRTRTRERENERMKVYLAFSAISKYEIQRGRGGEMYH